MVSQREYEMSFKLNAQLGSQYNSTFKAAQAAMQQYRAEYKTVASSLNDVSAYQRQQTAIENTKLKLQHLQTQYDNIQREMDETGTFSSALANKLDTKQMMIEKTTKAYQDQTDKLATYKARLEEAGIDTSNLEQETGRLKRELTGLRSKLDDAGTSASSFGDQAANVLSQLDTVITAVGVTKLLQQIKSAFEECTGAAIEYESAMAAVKRTTGGDDAYIGELAEEFRTLSKEIPLSASSLAEIAATAGQLGVAQENVETFTEVMAKLATTTDLSADNAATMLAQFSNITGSKDFERLGAVVASLGDATATTASRIVDMSQGMAATATIAGMSEREILALAAALGSTGTEAAAGSTAMSQLINKLYTAVETGDSLEEFASVANMTAQEFKTAWGESAVSAMNAFIQGLNDVDRNGQSAIVTLNDLGITNVRQSKAILNLANAGELLNSTITQANTAWEENTALQEKAGIMYGTTEAKLTMMQNSYADLQIEIGNQLTPVLQELYSIAGGILNSATDFVKENPGIVKAITSLTVGVGAFTAAITLAKVAQAAYNAVAAMNPYVLLATAIAGVTAAFISLAAMGEPAETVLDRVTESTRVQQERLATLQAEYERVCDTMGDTSYEAQTLKWQIDDLSEELATNTQTARDWHEQLQKTIDAHDAWSSAWQEATDTYSTEAGSIEALIGKLVSLSAQSNLTAGEIAQVNAIVGKLNDYLPDTNLTFDASTGSLSMTADQLREVARASIAAKQAEADYHAYLQAVETNDSYEKQLEYFEAQKLLAQNKYDEVKRRYDDADQNYMPADLAEEYNKAWEQLQHWNSEIDTTNGKLEENGEQLSTLEEKITGYAEAQEAAGETIEGVVASFQGRIDELTASYEAAYAAAKESIEGQYKLWDDVSDVSATSVTDVTQALQDQKAYWEAYNTNIQSLLGYSGQIEGLSEMVAEFGDGSADSVNMIAGMAEAAASGDPAQLQALVEAWQANKTAQDEAAQSLADLSTGYSDEMAKISGEIASAVEEMDMTEEARNAAINTIQGYIDGGLSMVDAVIAAYGQIGEAAINAIEEKLGIHSPSRVMMYEAQMTWQGFIDQTKDLQPDVVAAMQETAYGGVEAVGTQASAAVEAMVPYDSGGTGGSSVGSVQVNVTFELNGSAGADDLTGNLSEVEARIKESVLAAIEEAQEDQSRRAYV